MTATSHDLSVLATDTGHITIAALDHRDALKVELEKVLGTQDEQAAIDAVRTFKQEMLEAVGRMSVLPSAVMLEPEFSLPELASAVPDGVGITCALEAQGYFSDPEAGNSLMPGWHPARVRDVGAQVAKLLVLYRHDRGQFTRSQEELVATVVADAAEAGVPALIEPVPVDVVDDADRRAVILAAAERLNPIGPMLLKLPYPGAGACEELTAACGDRPWILLSWGVPFDEFAEQLTEACPAGASGFAVGRALWREAVDPATRAEFNATTLGRRFGQLAAIAATGRPWTATGAGADR
jgi:tagatose-1,6-bisphosphate aldolase